MASFTVLASLGAGNHFLEGLRGFTNSSLGVNEPGPGLVVPWYWLVVMKFVAGYLSYLPPIMRRKPAGA